MREKIKKLRHNHLLMMVLCCVIPLGLLFIASYIFGLSKSYLFWGVLLICLLSHYFMMKDMHKNEKKRGEHY
jgi:hypothetical protein